MTPAGNLEIRLRCRGPQVAEAHIASSRPDAVAQVLHGKTPEQLLAMLPLLFTLCGNAQAYAALSVCRALLAKAETVAAEAARHMLLHAETLREQAWRVLLDWPVLLGKLPDKATLARLIKLDSALKPALFENGAAFKLDSRLSPKPDVTALLAELAETVNQAIFAGDLPGFLTIRNQTELRDWLGGNPSQSARLLYHLFEQGLADLGHNPIACLPQLSDAALEQAIRQDPAGFCRLPTWQGQSMETSALNRWQQHPLIADLQSQYGNGLLPRLVARLLEIASMPQRLQALSSQLTDSNQLASPPSVTDGIAIAQIHAARGLLIHRLELRQGLVHDYRIVAPTEWNFHPAGVVAQGLLQLRGDEASLRRQAGLWIGAVDPCVEYRIQIKPD